MKICLLNPTVIIRRPVAELARVLADRGHQVTVLLPVSRTSRLTARRADAMLDHSSIHRIGVRSWEIERLLWSVPIDRSFTRIVREILLTHDVVQIWAPFYLIAVWPLVIRRMVRKSRAKIILTFDTFPALSFSLGKFTDACMRLYYRTFGRWFFRSADAYSLYGASLMPFLRRAGLPERPTEILPTGIFLNSEELMDRSSARAAIAKELMQPLDNRLVVLYVGLLNYRKGVDTLIGVAERVQRQLPAALFCIVGEGPRRAHAERVVRRHNLSTTVFFAGQRPDINRWYQAADLFFLPSRGEGLPGVLMESMALKLPVVSSNIPCIPDLVTPNANGILCNPEDRECFAQNIVNLLSHPAERHRIASSAYQTIQRFQWGNQVGHYEHFYRTLIAG